MSSPDDTLWLVSNQNAFAVPAAEPQQYGHCIIQSKTPHDWESLPLSIRNDMLNLISPLKTQLMEGTPPPISIDVSFSLDAPVQIHLLPQYQKNHDLFAKESLFPLLHTGGKNDPFYPTVKKQLQIADRIDIVTAFIQDSGLRILQPLILDALRRGAQIRVLGGDYLHITQGAALKRLLDWSDQKALHNWVGTLDIRILEAKKRSFHPKCWHFVSSQHALAYVGSSNLSYTALCEGVEWNLCATQQNASHAYEQIKHSISKVFQKGIPLTHAWVDDYIQRAEKAPQAPLPPGESEEPTQEIVPTALQEEALAALRNSRREGRKRALLVMATGLGKTFVSIFDAKANDAKRILFLAHRKELLSQAANSFRRLYPKARFAWFAASKSDREGDVFFASIQKIRRHLELFPQNFFDHIIIDEVHHAAAKSYRLVIEYFRPQFLLGLTATPERTDQSSIRTLFDDHCCFTADLTEGIERKFLVPFRYIGRLDPLDYKEIPWKNRAFDTESLATAMRSDERMQLLWKMWHLHPGERSILFCSSIAHADFVGQWLREKGISTAIIHSKAHSDPRSQSIEQLKSGELDAICAVDLFNEGIDIPQIDRVIMLRPTASGVIFLQQLGRGLRKAQHKECLTVLDLVGNHHVFLQRLQALSSISRSGNLKTLLHSPKNLSLPPECTIDIEIGLVELLKALLPSHKNPALTLFAEYEKIHGQRPFLTQLSHLGVEPKDLYPDSWVAFLSRQHKLNHTEKILWEHHKDWFVMLEQSPMTKSYKMVSLLIILAAQKLQGGMQLTPFVEACRDFIYRDPLLRNDAIQVLGNNVEPRRWQRYWLHWLSTSWKRGREWLQLRHDKVCIDVQVIPALKESFTELSMELIEYRLHRYRKRIQQTPVRFDTYLHIDGKGAYLQLPQSNAPLPVGNQKVRVPSGEEWIFEIAPQIRKAHPKGKEKNQLSLFLHTSKAPLGTRFRFSFLYDGWHLEILHAKNQRFLDRYEMERIDAWSEQRGLIHLPLRIPPSPLLFAIRSPTSLEGPTPIQKGDWLILKWSNSAPQKHKLIIQNNRLTVLDASTETEYNVIASLEDHISPHELAPPPMTTVAQEKLAVHFGLSQSPPKGSSRIDGHLFLFLDKTAQFHSPETFSFPISTYKNESAHVLLEQSEHVLYLGLARQEQARWHIEPLPWTCWKQFGGNTPHRTLPAVFLKRSVPVRQRVPSKGWVSIDGWQFQIVSKTPKGNIILRDKSGKEERINQTDIGWCLYAHDKLHRCTPSIHYIHNLRYLQGYRASAKQMRILRGAFACCFGEFHKKQRKESLDPVSFLLREFQSYKPKKGLSLQDPILQFTKQRILVFIQDCFLLGCPIHAAPQPQNMAAQEAQYEDLRSQGWKIITFWQHDLKKITLCKKRILKHLQSR